MNNVAGVTVGMAANVIISLVLIGVKSCAFFGVLASGAIVSVAMIKPRRFVISTQGLER